MEWQAPGGGGKVLQVVNATTNSSTTTTSQSYVDTNLSATITPTSATSKILVLVNQNGCFKKDSDTLMNARLVRGATAICSFLLGGGYTGSSVLTQWGSSSCGFLDDPETTSATTYKTQFLNEAGTGVIQVQFNSSVSTITLLEIGA